MPAETPLWTLGNVNLGPNRLRDVSLTIPEGVTAVLGWSGAGKTSLLNVLVGYEKPVRGILDGPRTLYWSPQGDGLWPHASVREHLEIVQCPPSRIDDMLTAFDLAERSSIRPAELSEGERSRLSVLRALAAPARVLVMDEPLSHVDPGRVGRYWSFIRSILETDDRSLVFSTHSPEAAMSQARYVVCLREGRVLHSGAIAQVYSNPPTSEVMECLGPGNWLTPQEAELWLDESIEEARCYRPEQIAIEPAHISHIVVRESRFLGSVAEVELRHVNAAAVYKFLHRPSGPHLQQGSPVSLRLRTE